MPTWVVIGLASLDAKLGELSNGFSNNQPILVKSRDAYYREVEKVFDSEGGHAGLYWPALSPQRIQERGGIDHPILEWISGDLRRAATSSGITSGDEVFAGSRVVNNSLRLYMSGEKVIHNEGGVNSSGFYVPQREFWPWHDQQHDVAYKPFEDFVDDWFASL